MCSVYIEWHTCASECNEFPQLWGRQKQSLIVKLCASLLTDTFYERLKAVGMKERKYILSLKRRECLMKGFLFDGQINAWDLPYYMNQVEQCKFAVNKDKLIEYFPLELVTKGLLGMYQELLGLTFTEVQHAHVWYEGVQLYSARDTETGEEIGRFYLDLHPRSQREMLCVWMYLLSASHRFTFAHLFPTREGKYGHAACFGLQPGCRGPDGERRLPVAAMVANFTKPRKGWPSLLQHHEVETYFHEFGHVMHEICSKVAVWSRFTAAGLRVGSVCRTEVEPWLCVHQTAFSEFSGTQVEMDFVEVPSQVLENWVWEKETLRRMSGHYKDGSPIPDNMLDKLIASRVANTGQMQFFSQIRTFHTCSASAFRAREPATGRAEQSGPDAAQQPSCRHSRGVCKALWGDSGGSSDTRSVHQQQQHLCCSAVLPCSNGFLSTGTNMTASFSHLAGGYDGQYYSYLWSEVYSTDMFFSRFKTEGLMNPKVGEPFFAFSLRSVFLFAEVINLFVLGWTRVQEGDSGGRRLRRWNGHAENLPGSGAAPGCFLPVQRTDQVSKHANILKNKSLLLINCIWNERLNCV